MQNKGRCAYCDEPATTTDHVVPSALYPSSKATSRVQRITVPACEPHNKGWQDDEVHFRNMLLISGDITPVVSELWQGKTRRSFDHVDGLKRARDLHAQLVPVQTSQGERHMVYPGQDERVMRIVRKVVRGLCHHHKLLSPVLDEQVFADVHLYQMPSELLAQMTSAHAEEDVLQYRFFIIDDQPNIHSCWLLRFFNRTPFFCIVYRSAEAADHAAEPPR
jgi:hypothetical protein